MPQHRLQYNWPHQCHPFHIWPSLACIRSSSFNHRYQNHRCYNRHCCSPNHPRRHRLSHRRNHRDIPHESFLYYFSHCRGFPNFGYIPSASRYMCRLTSITHRHSVHGDHQLRPSSSTTLTFVLRVCFLSTFAISVTFGVQDLSQFGYVCLSIQPFSSAKGALLVFENFFVQSPQSLPIRT